MYVIDRIPLEDMKENFEKFCAEAGGDDIPGDGGVFLVTKDGKPYAALLAIGEFEDYRAMKNKEYLAGLEESEEQIRRGEVVTLPHEQLISL